jgi:hypothetical protein
MCHENVTEGGVIRPDRMAKVSSDHSTCENGEGSNGVPKGNSRVRTRTHGGVTGKAGDRLPMSIALNKIGAYSRNGECTWYFQKFSTSHTLLLTANVRRARRRPSGEGMPHDCQAVWESCQRTLACPSRSMYKSLWPGKP